MNELESIQNKIYEIRGQRVTNSLRSQIVTSNIPDNKELLEDSNSLKSQFVTSNNGRGGVRYLPYAFTELGVAMLSRVY